MSDADVREHAEAARAGRIEFFGRLDRRVTWTWGAGDAS
jgi:hypothetical protein